MDKRAIFFFLSAVVCLAILPILPDDPEHPWLHRTPIALVILLVVLGVLSWLDHWSRLRDDG